MEMKWNGGVESPHFIIFESNLFYTMCICSEAKILLRVNYSGHLTSVEFSFLFSMFLVPFLFLPSVHFNAHFSNVLLTNRNNRNCFSFGQYASQSIRFTTMSFAEMNRMLSLVGWAQEWELVHHNMLANSFNFVRLTAHSFNKIQIINNSCSVSRVRMVRKSGIECTI